MQTQCPHCETRFRVTETQVNIADGLVRCGVCHEIFNAFDVAREDDLQPSLLDENQSPTQQTGIDLEQTAAQETQDLHLEKNLSGNDDAPRNDAALSASKTPASVQANKDNFDFFDETVNESLPHVVPEKFRDSYSAESHSVVSTLLWSIGILLLTATLLIEYVWFNREQFNQVPEVQAWINRLCQQVACNQVSMRDPARIELVSRNVYSHPNEKKALMVNVTLKNNADFAQPYPVMQIDFSDVRGGTIAARRFYPTEYLPVELQQLKTRQSPLLPPGTSATISMEIQDPGKQAMTYEFNFL